MLTMLCANTSRCTLLRWHGASSGNIWSKGKGPRNPLVKLPPPNLVNAWLDYWTTNDTVRDIAKRHGIKYNNLHGAWNRHGFFQRRGYVVRRKAEGVPQCEGYPFYCGDCTVKLECEDWHCDKCANKVLCGCWQKALRPAGWKAGLAKWQRLQQRNMNALRLYVMHMRR